MKTLAKTTTDSTGQVIARAAGTSSPAVRGALPQMHLLKRTTQRVRVAALGAPANPDTRQGIVFSPQQMLTSDGRQFLQHDSEDDDRILILASDRGMDTLERSPHWFGDGTFDTTPVMYMQVYSIHCVHGMSSNLCQANFLLYDTFFII